MGKTGLLSLMSKKDMYIRTDLTLPKNSKDKDNKK